MWRPSRVTRQRGAKASQWLRAGCHSSSPEDPWPLPPTAQPALWPCWLLPVLVYQSDSAATKNPPPTSLSQKEKWPLYYKTESLASQGVFQARWPQGSRT